LKGGERLKKQIKGINWQVKVLDEANRIIEMIGSSEDYDRVGDRVFMNGIQLDNYLSNPVILANHNYGSGTEKPTCIGKALNVSIQGSQLIFKIQFADTPNGQEWFYLYANKFMNASSIGFIPLESTPNKQGGYDFTQIELLELSLVAVPCNPQAVQRAFEDGKISKTLFNSINKESEVENMKVEEVQALIEKAVKAEVKTLEDGHKKELETKAKEIEGLNETIKNLNSLVEGKSGAKLSQATCDTLTKAVEGITGHVSDIKSLINVVQSSSGNDDDPDDNQDTKEYTQEEINKAVEENIKKILGGNN
jgi:hypothetical protein